MRFFDYELLNYDIGELGIFCLSYILFKFFKKKIRGAMPLSGYVPAYIILYIYIYIYIYIYAHQKQAYKNAHILKARLE